MSVLKGDGKLSKNVLGNSVAFLSEVESKEQIDNYKLNIFHENLISFFFLQFKLTVWWREIPSHSTPHKNALSDSERKLFTFMTQPYT